VSTTTVSAVRYQLEDRNAVLYLDDGKANALSPEMIGEIHAALTRAETEASAVVLVGRPDRFSGGFDLKVMRSGADAARELIRLGAQLLMRVYGSPLPIVAACTGHAVAAGAVLLLSSDVRIGADGAYRIGLNEVAIGLPVPVFALELARDRLTTTELGRATLRGHLYTPREAALAGFLDEVVPVAEVVARARQEATRLGALSRSAFEGTKRRLRGRAVAQALATLDEDMAAMTFDPPGEAL
jgi:enoyl-CoA hydratase